MTPVRFLALLLVVPAACGQVVEFYGGDWDGRQGLSSEKNGLVTSGSWAFDDFDHGGGPITAVWGNFLINYDFIESVHYEIRSGIWKGEGGTLHAAGKLTNVQYRHTGREGFGWNELLVKGSPSVPSLPAGRYYLAMQPRGSSGRAFIVTTSGKDEWPPSDPNPPPTGTPLKNGNSWFNSEFFGISFLPVNDPNMWGTGTWDFSYGVEVPEPLGFGVLLAALGFRRRH